MRYVVEARLDITVQHPLIRAGRQKVDLSDSVMRTPFRTEPVRARAKTRLEDGLEHQLQRRLDHPVGHSGNTQPAKFPIRLRDHLLPHRRRHERARLQRGPDLGQERLHPDRVYNRGDGLTVNPRRSGTLVTLDPVPRHREKARVAHEIEQVVEPAAVIGFRPTVQLCLHARYLRPRLTEARPQGTGLHQCVLRHRLPLLASPRQAAQAQHPDCPTRQSASTSCTTTLPPFALCPGSPGPLRRVVTPATTTAAPPQPDRISRRRAFPSPHRQYGGRVTARPVPTFTFQSIVGLGVAALPPRHRARLRRRPSPWPPCRRNSPAQKFPAP